MVQSKLTPVAMNVPIVETEEPRKGFITPYFQRLLQLLFDEKQELQDQVDLTAGIDIIAGVGLSGGGPLDGSADITIDLENTAVTPGNYGDATHYTEFTVDAQGRITAANETALPSSSVGAMTLISEQTPTGTGTVTFSSIPNTYRDLELRIRARGTNATTAVNCNVRFNGDTGANYDRILNGAASTAQTSLTVQNIPGASATAGLQGGGRTVIYDYKATVFQKTTMGESAYKTTATALNKDGWGGHWRSTAAITQIDIILSAGNYDTGSIVSLYGVM